MLVVSSQLFLAYDIYFLIICHETRTYGAGEKKNARMQNVMRVERYDGIGPKSTCNLVIKRFGGESSLQHQIHICIIPSEAEEKED